jgi:DNA helicase-2/ATP-dependent DNA helicase PcrA
MEWDHVVVAGVSAGLFPHRLAEDVEEERRVLHVAVTRGRETVTLLVDRGRPSPMVEELFGRAAHTPAPPPRSAERLSAGSAAGVRRRPAPADPGAGEGPSDPALEEALRVWRRQRATADGVPAYVVFADRTMRAIASRRPTTLVALRQVDGIGPTKLELYGEDILSVVAASSPEPDG